MEHSPNTPSAHTITPDTTSNQKSVQAVGPTTQKPMRPTEAKIYDPSPETQRMHKKPEATTPKISVIIVTHNGRKWLDKCIGKLYGKDKHLDIIVVDNASSDSTPETIREKWPEVNLIESDQNLGFGRANNIGLKHALDSGCDYAYLLNQDAWIELHDIFRLASIHANHPDYGILSPMQMQADISTPDTNFARCTSSENCPNYIADLSAGEKLDEVYDVNKVMAAHWLVSQKAIRDIGGFAPIFTHYGEDYNFLDRLSFHGLKAGICPWVKAVHDRGERTDETLHHALNRSYNSIFLPLACDITRPASKAFIHGLRALGRESLRQMRKYMSLRPLTTILKSFTDIGSISATRRETKIRGPHYLQ